MPYISYMQKDWKVFHYNKKCFLKANNKIFECQLGDGGLKFPSKKIEGDKVTPIGLWRLNSVYYRADRILRPKLKRKNILKLNQITRNCGWCDDVNSNHYNNYIKINKFLSTNLSYEKLWREDNAYDILLEVSYNINPTIKNKGSVIFIHCSFLDKRNTGGCIALKKKDLSYLVNNFKDKICIRVLN